LLIQQELVLQAPHKVMKRMCGLIDSAGAGKTAPPCGNLKERLFLIGMWRWSVSFAGKHAFGGGVIGFDMALNTLVFSAKSP